MSNYWRQDPAREVLYARRLDNAARARRYHRAVLRGRILRWLDGPAGMRWVMFPLASAGTLILAACLAALAYVHGW